jgi:hypothetical protein
MLFALSSLLDSLVAPAGGDGLPSQQEGALGEPPAGLDDAAAGCTCRWGPIWARAIWVRRPRRAGPRAGRTPASRVSSNVVGGSASRAPAAPPGAFALSGGHPCGRRAPGAQGRPDLGAAAPTGTGGPCAALGARLPRCEPRRPPFLPRSKSVGLLRALHVEGLPLTMTAAKLSELMSAYGPVQYAEVRARVGRCCSQRGVGSGRMRAIAEAVCGAVPPSPPRKGLQQTPVKDALRGGCTGAARPHLASAQRPCPPPRPAA